MFEKVLIANRGEIAIRVMRACRELDMKSVAVYSDADKTSLYTNYADESVPLGNPSPSQSYLNIEKIINAALDTGADAIHPGYGFLAENPELGRQCEKNGIKLIGPKGEHIEKMGDKITSKQIMKDALQVIGEPAKEKYVCSVCGYEYDGEVPFEELPEDYKCAVCKQPKSVFVKK